MTDLELLGLADAANEFSEEEGPVVVCLDVNTGDVWSFIGYPHQVQEGTICVACKGLFSKETITEEDLRAACKHRLSILIPQH